MLDGQVEVDGEVVTRLGTKVDPRTAVIRVDGQAAAAGHRRTSTWCSTSRAASSRRCRTPRAAAPSPTSSPTGPSGSSTSAGSTPTPRACSCSPTTATSPSGWRTRRTRWTRPTSPRSRARSPQAHPRGSCSPGVTLDDGPVTVAPRACSAATRARRAGKLDRRAGHPRGPQPDRAPPARPRRPPGAPAHPHRDRPVRAGRAARSRGASSRELDALRTSSGDPLDWTPARQALTPGQPPLEGAPVARAGQCGERPSSRRTPASTCSSGSPRWCAT